MIINGTNWPVDDIRKFATDTRDRHDPAHQEGNGYERCALCHYTRHPCDVNDLASMVLALLDHPKETP